MVKVRNLQTSTDLLDRLCSYVRADNLKIAPHFDLDTVDTEDLYFICSAKTVKDPQKRPLSAALVAACVNSQSVSGICKDEALEALAHLSYLKGFALILKDRLFLATELVRMCRSTLEEDQSIDYVRNLETGLTGLRTWQSAISNQVRFAGG